MPVTLIPLCGAVCLLQLWKEEENPFLSNRCGFLASLNCVARVCQEKKGLPEGSPLRSNRLGRRERPEAV
jgi:hypothetical protein